MNAQKIYVASSWRNETQPMVVQALRELGHDVYDFRNPPNRSGFGWEQISANWKEWSAAEFREALNHPLAIAGYASDINALRDADACVLVLPCGRSAHLELGFALGQGKRCAIVQLEPMEPELMYRECLLLASVTELRAAFEISGRMAVPSR